MSPEGKRIGRDRMGVGIDFNSDLNRRPALDPNDPTNNTIRQCETNPLVGSLLLCGDCDVVYDDNDDWNNCPRCGDELREVEKA